MVLVSGYVDKILVCPLRSSSNTWYFYLVSRKFGRESERLNSFMMPGALL